MDLKENRFQQANERVEEVLHQGDCVQLVNDKNLFQIIGIDDEHEKCWVRQWPLLPQGSPVFEVPIEQIASPAIKA